MIVEFRFTLDWFVEAVEPDITEEAGTRTRHLAHGRHLYFPTFDQAHRMHAWHVANIDRWLPPDGYRGDDPAYRAEVSDILRIERQTATPAPKGPTP